MKRTSSRILNEAPPKTFLPGLGCRHVATLECADRREDPMKVEITYCVI